MKGMTFRRQGFISSLVLRGWGLLALLLCFPRLAVGGTCPAPSASLNYNCSTIPEESPTGAWTIYAPYTHDSVWHSDGEKLYIDGYDTAGQAAFFRDEPSMIDARKIEIDVRAAIGRSREITWLAPIFLGFGISDGVKLALVWPAGSPEAGAVGINFTEPITTAAGVTDWTALQDYRLVLDKESDDPAEYVAQVYVNDVMVLSVPYAELEDVAGFLPDLQAPSLFGIGADQSDTVWDNVSYEVCPQVIPVLNPPPIEEQIINARAEVELLDTTGGIKTAIGKLLDNITTLANPEDQGQKVYDIASFIFQKKFAGVIKDDAERLETLLDFLRMSVTPDISRQDGFRKNISITNVELDSILFPQNNIDLHLTGSIELIPTGQHVSNSGDFKFGLQTRIGVINLRTGEIVRTDSRLKLLPDRLPANVKYSDEVEFYWDGLTDNGSVLEPEDIFFISATVEYTQLNPDTHETMGFTDSAMVPLLYYSPKEDPEGGCVTHYLYIFGHCYRLVCCASCPSCSPICSWFSCKWW
ncbi:MAG TPA: hypothetical protein VM425_11310 [Myxococcota bacterium]|nr:hypothetical protein [Myxococcota bacterium]